MSELRKEIGLLQGIGLMSTSLLGMGVFVVPSVVATLSGATSLWAWPIMILLIVPVVLTFARLGQRFPNAGGAAYFVGKAYGPTWDRLTAVLFLGVIPVAIPAGLHIAAGFCHAMFDLTPFGELLVQLLTLMLVLLLGVLGAKISGNVQIIIALIIAALVVVIGYFGDMTFADSVPGEFELFAVGEAMGVIFWCFIGIEAFAHMGEEFKSPERDFPRAMVIGFLLSAAVYWAYSAIVLKFGAYGSPEQEVTAMPTILYQLFGEKARYIAGIAGYLASFASINIYLQGFARLIWAQARQEKLPAVLHRTSGRDVPINALIVVIVASLISTVVVAIFALPLDSMIRYANGNFIMIYVLSMAAGWKVFQGFSCWLAAFAFFLSLLLLSMLGVSCWYVMGIFCAYWCCNMLSRESRLKRQLTEKS